MARCCRNFAKGRLTDHHTLGAIVPLLVPRTFLPMGGRPDCLDEGVRTARRPINHLVATGRSPDARPHRLRMVATRLAQGGRRTKDGATVLWMLVIARPWLRGRCGRFSGGRTVWRTVQSDGDGGWIVQHVDPPDGRDDGDRWVTALRTDHQMLPRIVVPTVSRCSERHGARTVW